MTQCFTATSLTFRMFLSLQRWNQTAARLCSPTNLSSCPQRTRPSWRGTLCVASAASWTTPPASWWVFTHTPRSSASTVGFHSFQVERFSAPIYSKSYLMQFRVRIEVKMNHHIFIHRDNKWGAPYIKKLKFRISRHEERGCVYITVTAWLSLYSGFTRLALEAVQFGTVYLTNSRIWGGACRENKLNEATRSRKNKWNKIVLNLWKGKL